MLGCACRSCSAPPRLSALRSSRSPVNLPRRNPASRSNKRSRFRVNPEPAAKPAPKPATDASGLPPDPNADTPTFRVSTSVVIVPTLVEKASGEVLYGLKPKDFSVFDNGVEQKVHVDDDLDTQPVSLVVCVERGRDAPLEFDKIGKLGPLLELFHRAGPRAGGSGRLRFQSDLGGTLRRRERFDHARPEANACRRWRRGDSRCRRLLVNLLEQQPPDHRRVLLLISESRDHGSHHFTVPQLVERIGTSNTLVLSLVFSPGKAEIIDWGRGNTNGGSELNILAPLIMTVNAMRRNTPKTLAALSGGEYDGFTREKGFETRVAEVPVTRESLYPQLSPNGSDAGAALDPGEAHAGLWSPGGGAQQLLGDPAGRYSSAQ